MNMRLDFFIMGSTLSLLVVGLQAKVQSKKVNWLKLLSLCAASFVACVDYAGIEPTLRLRSVPKVALLLEMFFD